MSLVTSIKGLVLLGCCLGQAVAAPLYITLGGTLIVTPPECTVNGNSITDIPFGEVHETLIDGVNYKRTPIAYGLSCTNVYSNALKMKLSWNNVTLGGGSAVQTNRANFGLAIYQNTTRLNNNTVINFTNGTPPVLYAVPVKPTGTILTDGGSFTGTLTMQVEYQ
ncbi:TPA: fimbrial protein [Serratia fonticola]|uniref:fimbrial protein n=1 Tax=Serratia fonticola TaxID=47917 RepID=UPI00217AD016|nr:fimbrial protein [Serratia fonticola]CAI1221764.1 putative minor fimbrial subunit StfF [Serratia fonticola]CAI2497245.1 putative minor fimbrial subunit StfF [Serratia fonticola]